MTDVEQDKPFGILLATTFFILIGTYFFAIASYLSSITNYLMVPLIILTFIGIFYILLGWGVLLLKKWAYYISIISTVGSLFFMLFNFGLLPLYLATPLFFTNVFCHIGIIIYIVPRSNLFGITSTYPNPAGLIRFCPDCKKNIPFDALICPYCGKKFKSYL